MVKEATTNIAADEIAEVEYIESVYGRGMLWQMDESKSPIAERIGKAITYFADKYGRRPRFVMMSNRETELPKRGVVDGITIARAKNVPPNHLYLLINDGVGA